MQILGLGTNLSVEEIKENNKNNFEIMAMCPDMDEETRQMMEDRIVRDNLRLIPLVLKSYGGAQDEDMVQLGFIGLIKAIRAYDVTRKVPFANYACFIIENEFKNHLEYKSSKFEYLMADSLSSLDSEVDLGGGDKVDRHELIADATAEDELNRILNDNALDDLFESAINPAILSVATNTKGQVSKVDPEKWRALEVRYILDMADIDCREEKLTFTVMAEELGVSIQNVRERHKRVIKNIRERLGA